MKKAKLLHSKPIKWLYRVTQKMGFPGNKNLSMYAVMEFFVRTVSKKDLQMRSSALSFTFFLALFPSAIFFFTLIAYLPVKQDHAKILFFISEMMPKSAYETISETLEDILKTQRRGLLSIGFFSALYFSTNGFHSLMNSLNKYSGTEENRPFWKQRLVAFGLTFFASVLILLSVLMITIGNITIKWLSKNHWLPNGGSAFALNTLNYLIVALICFAIVGAIYYYAPAKHRMWKFFSAGAIFACISILVTTTGFSYYVNYFNTYNKVYGSIGVLIVIMMLIYINMYILLLGYELNVAIDLAAKQENKNIARRQRQNKIIFLDIPHDESNNN